MNYLVLSADYGAVSLQEPSGRAVEPIDAGLPDDLVHDLAAWNARYQAVIPMSLDERQAADALISELDEQGQQLARRVAASLRGGAKVQYYSEGRLSHLR